MPVNIFKIIVRFDFPIVYEILDNLGTCLAVLNRGHENYWQTLGISDTNVGAIANRRKPSEEYSHVHVEPTSFIFISENFPGIEIDKIEKMESLNKANEIFATFSRTFQVDQINRAGFRVFAFSTETEERTDKLANCKCLLRKEHVTQVQESFGEVSTFAWTFEGTAKDKSQYRFQLGPHTPDEPFKYYENLIVLPPKRVENLKSYVTYDLDIFEANLSIKGTTLSRWARPKIALASAAFQKTIELINRCEEAN